MKSEKKLHVDHDVCRCHYDPQREQGTGSWGAGHMLWREEE